MNTTTADVEAARRQAFREEMRERMRRAPAHKCIGVAGHSCLATIYIAAPRCLSCTKQHELDERSKEQRDDH